MVKKLPATIYVKTETDSGTTYLVADADAHGLVMMGEKLKIGVYKLVEVQMAEGIAKLTKVHR